MGLDNEKLVREFTGIVPVVRNCNTFEDAMKAAKELATSGDTVLLSPACASFDLFRNYEDRGRKFKEWVKSNVLNEE
jgi:UDP-N-acetylmuramoylalanine--D-glutamate ligase